jgi:hypothetical protein
MNENLRMGCGLSKAHSNPEVLVSHGSARLTVHDRRLIVERHRAGWPQAHIAAAMGVSRKRVKTWIERRQWASRQDLRIAIVTWIERTYPPTPQTGRSRPIDPYRVRDHQVTTPAVQAA